MANFYRVAVVKWADSDGIATAIHDELVTLGHEPVYFRFDQVIPPGTDIVFSFAPYGRFIQIPGQLADMPVEKRPVFIHWNMENPPDLRLPWVLVKNLGAIRSWIDRLSDRDQAWTKALTGTTVFSQINRKFYKFRYVGEYHYAYRQGWMHMLIETSEKYAQLHRQHGIPAMCVPWGTVKSWHADLNFERDIDVLWMGKRRTKRRSILLDRVCNQLLKYGVNIYVADNEANPFIYGQTRTEFLNRAKITLNLLPTWYDNAFPYRFHIAAGNRSLVVSEEILPHCPVYKAGTHYVSSPPETLAETILNYLENDEARHKIIENAYELVTTQLTFGNSIKTIMEAVDQRQAISHAGRRSRRCAPVGRRQ